MKNPVSLSCVAFDYLDSLDTQNEAAPAGVTPDTKMRNYLDQLVAPTVTRKGMQRLLESGVWSPPPRTESRNKRTYSTGSGSA